MRNGRTNDRLKSKINIPYLPILKNGRFFVAYCKAKKNECTGKVQDCDTGCENYQILELGSDTRPFPSTPFTEEKLAKLIERKTPETQILKTPASHDRQGFAYIPFCTYNMHLGVPEERICLTRQCSSLHRLYL